MIVLDCNAAVEMARGTKDGSALLALVDEDEHTLAPDFFSYELANVISKYVRGRYLERDEALSLGRCARRLVDDFRSDEDLWLEVVSESVRLDHPAYDLFYLVLARRQASTLFTLDKKLQRLCLNNGVDCLYLDNEF